MVDFLVIRVFDCLGYDLGALQRWQGPVEGSPDSQDPSPPLSEGTLSEGPLPGNQPR
jgi:4-hydroxy-3-polyprenylbenzoate decarboxylase